MSQLIDTYTGIFFLQPVHKRCPPAIKHAHVHFVPQRAETGHQIHDQHFRPSCFQRGNNLEDSHQRLFQWVNNILICGRFFPRYYFSGITNDDRIVGHIKIYECPRGYQHMIADVAAADNHRVCIHADIIANSGSTPPYYLEHSLSDIPD